MRYLLYAESCLSGRAYIGEVLKHMLIHIDISGTNVDELQDNNSASHTKGTTCLVNG